MEDKLTGAMPIGSDSAAQAVVGNALTKRARWIASWLIAAVCMAAMVFSQDAKAAAYSFPGSLPGGCSGSGTSYTCGALVLASGDTVSVGNASTTITFTSLNNNNAQFNAANTANLTLSMTGTLTVAAGATIKANVTAGAVSSSGAVTYVGNLTTTGAGAISLGAGTTVSGALTTVTGAITLLTGTAGTYTTVGSINSGGTVTINSYNSVDGPVVGYLLSAAGHNTINGSITSTTTYVSLGGNATVNGSIISQTYVDTGSNSNIQGSITASTSYIDTGTATTVNGSLSAQGTYVDIHGSASVTGSIYAKSYVSMTTNSTVGGGIAAQTTVALGTGSTVAKCVQSQNSNTITVPSAGSVGGVCCGAMGSCANTCATGTPKPAACSTSLTGGLVAEYLFEQTSYNGTAGEVLDTSGNQWNGKIVGSVTSVASGKTCRGIQIGANTTAAAISAFDTGIDVNSVGNNGAISFWYKSIDSGSSAHRTLFDATVVSGQQFYLYRDDQGTSIDLNFVINDTNGTRTDAGEVNVLSEGTWTHIAVTWAVSGSGSHMKLYVNGVLKYDESFDGHSGLHAGIGTLYFGDNRNAVAPEPVSANGYIDQIRLYNYTLSAAEVGTDMANHPSCVTLHHMEVTAAAASAATGASVTYTIKACGSADCSTLYTGGVTGNLAISGGGVSVTYTTGAAFTIASGSSSTTESVTMTPAGTVTVDLSSVSPTPSGSPAVYCGMGTAAASGASCSFTVGSPLHHLELTTSSGTSVTCVPTTYTVKACASADCSSTYTAGMTGTLAVSGVTVNYPSGAGFTIASGSASTTVSAHATTVGTATASLTSLSVTPSNTPQVFCGMGVAAASGGSCAISTVDSGLLFDVSDHVSDVSQAVTVSAVRSSNNATVCTPAFASVSKNVTFKCTYSNPASGTKAVRVGGAALNAGNNAAAVCDGTGSAVSLSFNASGVASTTVQYADVGQVGMTAAYTGSGSDAGLSMTGSDSFIAKPASFGVALVTSPPIAAGNAFSATITARNSNGNTTPNFGRETAVTADYVRLSWTKYRPTGAAVVAGIFTGTGMGIAPFISSSSFTNGVATLSDLKWTEVGSGDLSAAFVPATYLGVATAVTGTTGTTGAVGPFVPHHFDTSPTQGCGSFTYSGQPVTLAVTARNAANATTYNYDGSLNTSPNHAKAVTLSMVTGSGSGSLGNGTIAASSFGAGVASTTTPVYTFTNKITAPTSVQIRATDSDGVTSSAGAEGTLLARSGRVKLSNAFGSEKLVLRVPLQAQYWNGRSWVVNSLDSCTTIPAAAVVRASYLDHKGAATTGWTTTPSGPVIFVAGNAEMVLSAPSPLGSVGSVDIALNLGSTVTDQSCLSAHPASTGAGVPWLRSQNGACSTTFDRDPSARITFGIYSPESKRMIFSREMH